MEKKKRITFIEGERIELLPFNPENVKIHARWANDPKTRLYARNVFREYVDARMYRYLKEDWLKSKE